MEDYVVQVFMYMYGGDLRINAHGDMWLLFIVLLN